MFLVFIKKNDRRSKHGCRSRENPKQPRITFELEELNDPWVTSAFQASIDGIFTPLATLLYDDAELDSIVTQFIKMVTYTATELLD